MTLGELYDKETEFWRNVQESYENYRLTSANEFMAAVSEIRKHRANHDPGDEDRS